MSRQNSKDTARNKNSADISVLSLESGAKPSVFDRQMEWQKVLQDKRLQLAAAKE